MSRRTLPAAIRDRLTHILTDVERGLIAAESLLMTANPQWTGDVLYINLTDQRADEHLRLALVAVDDIIDAIAVLDWSAADRRQVVDQWHEQVRQLCGIDRAAFVAARRRQTRWLTFREQPEPPAPTSTRSRTPLPRPGPDRRPFKEQLATAIATRRPRLSVPALADASRVNERTIRRYLAGDRVPRRPDLVAGLERVLRVSFHLPGRGPIRTNRTNVRKTHKTLK